MLYNNVLNLEGVIFPYQYKEYIFIANSGHEFVVTNSDINLENLIYLNLVIKGTCTLSDKRDYIFISSYSIFNQSAGRPTDYDFLEPHYA